MPGPVAFGPTGAIHGAPVSLHAGTRTATGQGDAVALGDASTLRLTLNVSAASGTTPSMTVTVEQSADGTTWYTAGTFAAKTTTGVERKSFGGLDRFARVSWAITGTTPSFTFTVAGEAVGG